MFEKKKEPETFFGISLLIKTELQKLLVDYDCLKDHDFYCPLRENYLVINVNIFCCNSR